MTYAVTLVFEGVGEDQYWAVNEKLGIARDGSGGYPDGLIVHVGGPAGDNWVVTELWESQEAQLTFMKASLGEALAAAGVPMPAQVIDTTPVNVMQAS